MIGCLQLLSSDGPSTGDNARLLGIVQREAERLSGLVQAFLTYARPAEPRRARVSLPLALADIVTSVSHGLTASRIRLLDIGDIDVCVDNDQLRQVLWNVLTNADRIGDSIGQRLDIEVSATIDGNEVIIAVDDSGPGVPEDLRQRIFEPFFTTRPDGNGLGLATSHQLVSQNGGVMGVLRSPTLGGARFTLRFPLHAKTERAA
jgi:two-component system sensor histidine kinase PilS (NtrC family)